MSRSVAEQPTAQGRATTSLFLEVFRLHGRLLSEGDRLLAYVGLSSARWQLLGTISLSRTPQTVAWLARTMGVNRQGVQRLVNELANADILTLADNPHHRRAKLVLMTRKGIRLFETATRIHVPWINRLSKGLSAEHIITVAVQLRSLRKQLEQLHTGVD
jgi:DNA-binding MarR family transcriptional regulator